MQSKEKVVFKPNFSTKAKGMQVLTVADICISDLEKLVKRYGFLYLQEKIELGDRDYGVAFMGNDYIGAYARVAGKNAWNTTTQDGGHYEACQLDESIVEVARKAKNVFDLDFCSVDVALVNGQPMVFEVSAFGGFNGLLKGANVDAAKLLAQKIYDDLD
jgi:ribosomal protein S6--L-glutamate ligase